MLNKYLVIENVPYEGKNTWTVFAESTKEATEIVRKVKDICEIDISVDTLKYNIKGTKTKGIIRSSHY